MCSISIVIFVGENDNLQLLFDYISYLCVEDPR